MPFLVHAGSCVWRLLSSSVAMRRREERERECAARVSFPAGVMHRVWLVWWVPAPCALCGGRGFLLFPVGCGNELGEYGGGYILLLHGGWLLALCAFLAWMPSRGVWTVRLGLLPSRHVVCSLSLYPLHFVPLPLVAFFFFCLTDQLTGSSDFTTGDDDCDDNGVRRVGPCALVLLLVHVCVTAAGSPGDVSGDVDAVVVPVDVSCAPSDGSLSYRVCVCVCVEEVFCCQC
ncbi:hypothetical protein TcCL_ESM07943 [Trypanosoma cruzi]|nr:hypothetical protein TcCL_ESM07943 [Trypanosoma cruzi]